MAADVTRLYKVQYTVVDASSGPLLKIKNSFVAINLETETALQQAALLGRSLAALGKEVPTLNRVDIAMRRLAQSAQETGKGFGAMGTDVTKASEALRTTRAFLQAVRSGFIEVDEQMMKLTQNAKTLKALREGIVNAQRAAFGLKMNLQEGNQALQSLVIAGQGLGQTATNMGQVSTQAQSAEKATRGAVASTALFVAKMAALNVASEAVSAFGNAMRDAQEFAKNSADEVIRIRDGLRELANLQGKAGVDDATLRGAVSLRQATGMSDAEAKQFQEQFKGSFPLAAATGNITDDTGNAVRDEVGRSAVRVGLDPKTAGDLAGSIGMFGAVPSGQVGAGQVQQIIDQLNDGRGNLTPLVKELMKGGAATVGPTSAFHNLQERAAALKVTTGIVGSPGQASTALGAAIRGLNGFTKAQGATLSAYGVESGQDLPTQIDKIAPLIASAIAAGKSPTAALAEAGFGNVQDRNAIVGLVGGRDKLRQSVAAVREADGSQAKAAAAGDRAIRLNREFYRSDKSAANRVAEANLTRGKVERGLDNEPLAIARKNAEAQLLAEKQLDTPSVLLSQKLRNLAGQSWLTGVDQRQKDIDERVRSNLSQEASRVGVKIPSPGWAFATAEGQARADLNQFGPEILGRGGNPYGGAPTGQAKAAAAGDPQEVVKQLIRIGDGIEQQNEIRNRALPIQPGVFPERR